MRLRLPIALATVMVACAAAAPAPPSGGYLRGAAVPDMLQVIQPAPVAGSATDLADRAIFKTTRALEGGPRWSLATNDVDFSIPALLRDFSCAAGVGLDPTSAPALTALLQRVGPDVATAVNAPKTTYKRPRPYLVEHGDICVARTDALAHNWDYPSGHATWGWTVGLLLAELAPGRAGPILARARAFGESRVVCGVHNASAVMGGAAVASALVAALHGDAAFRADLEAVRREMARLGASPSPSPQACEAEAALTARTPW